MDAAYASNYRMLWERHWWWRSREAFVVGRLGRLAKSGGLGRILDVGCGDGLFFPVLSRFGEVEGLEPDASLISPLPKVGQIKVGGLDGSFRPERPYDLALMLDVLEHIEDDRAALERLRTGLRPGGRLLLTVPAFPWLWSRHDEINSHFRRYTRETLSRVLVAAGYVVEDLRPFFVWTVPPMLLRRCLAPAGGGASYAVTVPPEPINTLLTVMSRVEHAISSRASLPWGSSLYALARPA